MHRGVKLGPPERSLRRPQRRPGPGPGRPRSGSGRGRGSSSAPAVLPPPPPPSLEEVLPTWRATRELDLRRSSNVLLALGLQPVNKKVARRMVREEHNRMHGIMEGPGEEVTVAAVASDSDHHHHHHHNHNGVSASLLANGGTSKDIPSPDVPSALDGLRDTPVADADTPTDAESVVSQPESLKEKSDAKPETCPKDAKDEEDASPCVLAPVAENEETPSLEENNIVSNETEEPDGDVSPSEDVAKLLESEPETESEAKKDTENATDSASDVEVESKTIIKKEESCLDAEDNAVEQTPAETRDKEDTSNVSQEDGSVLDNSETSETSVKESSSVSDQETRMEVDDVPQDPATLKDTEENTPSSEKLADNECETENLSTAVAQKRSSDESLCDSQAKKQCLPDIVCNDASALDLSSIRKKDSKEPKIALKPQSLLLSKLQGDSEADRTKRDLNRKESSISRGTESIRPNKIVSSAARSERRRSSRDEKERSSHGKRSNDVSNIRIAERDQVLREMRDKVLSLYKERDRVAKEDSLLRDLLEPERDTLLTEIVEAATINGGISELDRVSGALEADIRVLTVEICNKEAEWNELIRKRKLKEELALRVQRRKQVLVLAGDCEEEFSRQNSFEGESRLELKRESQQEARHEMPPKSGQELLAAALRLGSRNVEDYHHQRGGGSSPLAVRIQARANELLTGSAPYNERKSSGLLPGLSHMQPQSLLQSQLSKPSEISPTSPQSQFLLQHLQRQRTVMGVVSSSGSACRLSSSVSLSAIPTSTTSSSALSTCLPSATSNNKPSSRMDKQMSVPGGSRSQQRPILPKPISAVGSHVVSDASLDATGGGIIGEGRQGPILDVKSIIADYRSKHPEGVPRRGRRMKTPGMVSENMMSSARPGSSSGGSLLSMSLPALGSGSQVRTGSSALHGGVPVDLSELGFVLTSGAGSDGPSRPSSTESTLSGAASQMNQDNGTGMSFKDVLVQFAKMTNDQNSLGSSASLLGRAPPPQPHYPEVTLHPVVTPASISSPTPASSSPTTSLLHGILTKSNNQSASGGSPSMAKPTTFSPTLARLLTAPERSSSSSGAGLIGPSQVSSVPSFGSGASGSSYPATGPVLLSDLLSGSSPSKTRSELTITPVTASSVISNQIQALTSASSIRGKQEVVVLDGEDVNGEDGDTDSDERRLIIDEGDNTENGEGADGESNGARQDRTRSTVPHCQGCNERDAEFVCAGCQRQWYCSRECQIAAWDEHSEVCFPPSVGTSDN